VLGFDDAKILCVVRVPAVVRILDVKRTQLESGMKLRLTNYQKNDGKIFTSEQSVLEVDVEESILLLGN
jgi:hypothetical protein